MAESATKSFEITPPGSRLIAALSADDQNFFYSKSQKINLTMGQILCEPGDPLEFVYFPTCGVISIIALMRSGGGVEVGVVGFEGMVGIGTVLGSDRIQHQALVQAPGEAHCISSADLLALRAQSPKAEALLLRFANGFLNLVAQGAACNALHKAEERLARWILLVHDRLQQDSIPMTHEFIANMLGTRRATVTVVANVLERQGLISLARGEIRVLDRERLLKVSCECYSVMHDAVTKLG